MNNDQYQLLNQKFNALRKEYFEVKKSFNNFIYEIAQINIWLFLGVVGAIGISESKYKTWALVMTGVFFVYQIILFNRLKMGHQVNKDHLNTLIDELDYIRLELKKIGYEHKASKDQPPKELNFFWLIQFPIFINWSFYVYILSIHFNTIFNFY